MPYQVLARKLRPAKFSELIGQEYIARALRNSVSRDRAAHAFLFVGSRGIGKTSCARILTKALNCQNPDDGEPCNTCEMCTEVNVGNGVDVYEIDAASNRGIEHIRDLRENVKYSPAKAKYKVYIIDEAHMLTIESFNALLKTLEEPPPHVKFILATTDAHKIPQTVVSRCQHFDFRRISTTDIVDYLTPLCNDHSFKISDHIIRMIAINSMGGLRDALTSLEMIFNFADASTDNEEIFSLLGWNDPDEIFGLLEFVVNTDVTNTLRIFNGMLRRGISLSRILSDLLTSIKDLSQCKESSPNRPPDHILDKTRFIALLGNVSISELTQYFTILLECEILIRKSSYAAVSMEMSLIKMCRVEKLVGLREIVSFIKNHDPKKLNLPFKPSAPDSTHPPHLTGEDRAEESNTENNPFYGNQTGEQTKSRTDFSQRVASRQDTTPPPPATADLIRETPVSPRQSTAHAQPVGQMAEAGRTVLASNQQRGVANAQKQDNPTTGPDNPTTVPGNPTTVPDNPTTVTDNPTTVTDNPTPLSKSLATSTFPVLKKNTDPPTGSTGLPTDRRMPETIAVITNEDSVTTDDRAASVDDTDELPIHVKDAIGNETDGRFTSGHTKSMPVAPTALGETLSPPDRVVSDDDLYAKNRIETYFKENLHSTIQKTWIEFIAFCQYHFFQKKENFALCGFLKNAVPLKLKECEFVIGVSKHSLLNEKSPNVIQKINDWMSAFLKKSIILETVTETTIPAFTAGGFETSVKTKIMDDVKQEFLLRPHVKELQKIYTKSTVHLYQT